MSPHKFAALILLAQKTQEESWDPEKREYALDYTDAAIKVCPPEWAYPIGLLNSTGWNDIQLWAQSMASEKQRKTVELLRQFIDEEDPEDYVGSLTAVADRLNQMVANSKTDVAAPEDDGELPSALSLED